MDAISPKAVVKQNYWHWKLRITNTSIQYYLINILLSHTSFYYFTMLNELWFCGALKSTIFISGAVG